MRKVKVCKKCIQPSTRPGIVFDENGVCSPCNVFESYKNVNWGKRKKDLLEIADWGRKNSKSKYNCIISASGGKDSMRQALYARDTLNMNPLLISLTFPPEFAIDRGVNNISNLISLGFTIYNITPSPAKWKKLMLNAFLKYGNYGRSTELALYSCAPILATKLNIPLIFRRK